eukprot:TRINITY_DN2600_c0_g1_i4.p1 TRINITY_DN2600_c0_g1~~TRINITY_DN2600_c0_g1_i4.p1  ORF type:complete len:180 (+),score=25.52 TRINITY_DN2600_c0_g1_i4:61-540(+)
MCIRDRYKIENDVFIWNQIRLIQMLKFRRLYKKTNCLNRKQSSLEGFELPKPLIIQQIQENIRSQEFSIKAKMLNYFQSFPFLSAFFLEAKSAILAMKPEICKNVGRPSSTLIFSCVTSPSISYWNCLSSVVEFCINLPMLLTTSYALYPSSHKVYSSF